MTAAAEKSAQFVPASIAGQTLVASAKKFATGSDGYYGSGVVVLDGERFQTSVSMVRIGSKPKSK